MLLRRIAVVAGTAGLTIGLLAVPATAAPRPTGPTCGMVSTSDPQLVNEQLATFWGGPLTLGDDSNPLVVYSGDVTCTIQAGAFSSRYHNGADWCSNTGPTAGVTAVLQPSTCNFVVLPGDDVFLCTQVDIVGGPTLYWSADDNNPGFWTTSAGAPCERAGNGWFDEDSVIVKRLIDEVLCPILTPFFPPHGDIGIFWDCPPYSSSNPVPAFDHGFYFVEPETAA